MLGETLAIQRGMKKISPTTQYGSTERIQEWIKKEKDPKQANRLNAIRLLMLGYENQEVGKICDVGQTCIRQWVMKWNQGGKEALESKSGGSASRVTEEHRAGIREVVEIRRNINGRIVTGKLICGYLKKTPDSN
jgi:transposase